jgi:hypothetical protein
MATTVQVVGKPAPPMAPYSSRPGNNKLQGATDPCGSHVGPLWITCWDMSDGEEAGSKAMRAGADGMTAVGTGARQAARLVSAQQASTCASTAGVWPDGLHSIQQRMIYYLCDYECVCVGRLAHSETRDRKTGQETKAGTRRCGCHRQARSDPSQECLKRTTRPDTQAPTFNACHNRRMGMMSRGRRLMRRQQSGHVISVRHYPSSALGPRCNNLKRIL